MTDKTKDREDGSTLLCEYDGLRVYYTQVNTLEGKRCHTWLKGKDLSKPLHYRYTLKPEATDDDAFEIALKAGMTACIATAQLKGRKSPELAFRSYDEIVKEAAI